MKRADENYITQKKERKKEANRKRKYDEIGSRRGKNKEKSYTIKRRESEMRMGMCVIPEKSCTYTPNIILIQRLFL